MRRPLAQRPVERVEPDEDVAHLRDRVDAEVRARAVRGAALRSRSRTRRSPCGRSQTRICVGSATIAASGAHALQHRLRADRWRAPRRRPRSRPRRRAARASPPPPPRPGRRRARPSCRRRRGRRAAPPATRGTSGSAIAAEPDRVRCARSGAASARRPIPRAVAITFGRPGAASSSSTSSPASRAHSATNAAISPSPGPPSAGFDRVDRDQPLEQREDVHGAEPILGTRGRRRLPRPLPDPRGHHLPDQPLAGRDAGRRRGPPRSSTRACGRRAGSARGARAGGTCR